MNSISTKYKGILLLGPTGVGKTPFGEQLETEELWNRKVYHFDFGEHLRKAANDSLSSSEKALTNEEINTIKKIISENALLTDKDFPIAEKLLKSFIEEKEIDPAIDIIALNGLPRHIGQAEKIDEFINISLVIVFSASPHIIAERIKINSGGDRAERTDDSIEEIERKLEIYKERTIPLIEYYKGKDRNIVEIPVDEETLPIYIFQALSSMPTMV